VSELGLIGLGQHSGAVSQLSDFQALPRFSIATGFDGLDSFAIKTQAQNLPVTVLSPLDGIVQKGSQIPELNLRLEEGDYKKELFSCYGSGQGRIRVSWVDKSRNLVNVVANQPIQPGRSKYNCTAPSRSKSGVYYWFSFLWIKPEADGSWYQE
jgi:hypothetical protein